MLALTPAQLETAAERAFFTELTGWETGGATRGAIVASLPVVDGPMNRRQADAVLFVPEGLAVVRVVEVIRQSGVVRALPEGAWTIGSGGGPGEVLRLSGGGSTPLDGLMRAGMDAAVRLRRAGLEPGRIARLTVLYGQITGLEPADGDLGEGDQVALVEPRSLLMGIARASRHAGTDNPRLWTTADVRAALEALGLRGRSPSVEELNGEGFPYSPYVLRRPDLLTPAAMAAAPPQQYGPTAPAVSAPAAAPGRAPLTPLTGQQAALAGGWPGAPGGPGPGPLVDPAAAAHLARAATPAQARDQRAPVPQGTAQIRTTVQPDRSARPADPSPGPEPATGETGGLDGLLAAGAVEDEPAANEPGFWDQPVHGVPLQRSRVQEARVQGAGVQGAAAPTSGTSVFSRPGPYAPPAHHADPPAYAGPPSHPEPPRPDHPGHPGYAAVPEGASRRTLVVVLAGLLFLLLIAGGGFVLLRSGDGGGRAADATGSSGSTASSAPPSSALELGSTQTLDGVTYTLRATEANTSCQGHAYGAVAGFFDRTDCAGLTRALFSAEVGGKLVVVAVSQVRMADAGSAQALLALADTDNTGNVSDLLREGSTYDGAPATLGGASYASQPRGATAVIVETAAAAAGGPSSDVLTSLADSAVDLDLPGAAPN